MTSLSEIYELITKECGVNLDQLKPDSDLFSDLGIDGDDFFELIDEFARRFSVDVSSYLWYFHHGEEASFNIGGLFFSPPNRRVQRIPVTPELLLASANSHRWMITYPVHHLPSRRVELLINNSIFILLALAGLILGWLNFFG